MSLPVALQPNFSLAAALRELGVVASAGAGTCPWCGGWLGGCHSADTWPPRVDVECTECGSLLTLPRRLLPKRGRA